jgi:hypothetical protein
MMLHSLGVMVGCSVRIMMVSAIALAAMEGFGCSDPDCVTSAEELRLWPEESFEGVWVHSAEVVEVDELAPSSVMVGDAAGPDRVVLGLDDDFVRGSPVGGPVEDTMLAFRLQFRLALDGSEYLCLRSEEAALFQSGYGVHVDWSEQLIDDSPLVPFGEGVRVESLPLFWAGRDIIDLELLNLERDPDSLRLRDVAIVATYIVSPEACPTPCTDATGLAWVRHHLTAE